MNILIVDDHEENLYLLESLLKGNGHAVQQAATGVEALKMLLAGGIDLIISDILMPVMDGFQLCRKVKTDAALRAIPFIIYTATYTGPQDEAFALKIGADRFILKPCEPDVFMAAIEEVTAAAGRRGTAPPLKPILEEEALKLYSERLVRKLEQKMLQAESEIKARQAAEQSLRDSRERLVAAQRLAKMGDFTWDLETGNISWSDALFDLLMYEKTEIFDYARINSKVHHPDDLERITRWIDECIASGKETLTPNEYRIIRKDGGILFIRTVGVIRRRPGKKPMIFATVQDITERRQAEDALRESEEKYRSILDNIEAGYYEVDLAGNFTFFNHSMCEILGYSSSELMGMNNREYMDTDNSGKVFQTFNRVFKIGKKAKAFDWELIKKSGETCHVDTSVALVRDTDGNAIGFRGIARDITERKQAETERIKLQDQLIQAQKMESVGRLAGGVAHDFNNMLNVILGYAELAMNKTDADDSRYDDLKEIYEAAVRSAEITRQLLAFARKQIVIPRAINLNETVEGILKMMRRLIGEDIDLVWHPGASLWPVKLDPSQIDQILANLCVNARDAIGSQGEIVIETGNARLDEDYCAGHSGFVPGDFVLLAVSDDGRGMDRETLNNIFEPFFTTKGVGEGTGLGLATVYGIVRQNDGFINVYSETGQGATFKIYLPRYEGEPGTVETKKMVEVPQGQGETLLVVEDEAAILKLVRKMLAGLGYKVLAAPTPVSALKLAQAYAAGIDLLMTDVVMPEMSGRDLAERLQALHSGLKVLFMSGYTEEAIAHRGILEEGVHFIQKPFNRRDLARKVREALEE